MQGILQTMHAERGFGFLRDTQGTEIVLQRRGVTPPSCIAPLAVGMVVEFEAEPDPTGLPRYQSHDRTRGPAMTETPPPTAWRAAGIVPEYARGAGIPRHARRGGPPGGADLGWDERRAA